jgi:GH24 family phage-related lysozyme (muramidase)
MKAFKNIANDNNIEVQKVIKSANEEAVDNKISANDDFNDNKLKLTVNEKSLKSSRIAREYDGEGIDYNTHPNSIYNFEGFRGIPYKDAGGMSIGYGTQLFTRYNDSKKTNWQKVFFEKKLGNRKLKNKNIVIRNGSAVRINTISSITREEARIAADIDLEERQLDMFRIYPWLEHLPGDAQLGFLDMTYNMGIHFSMSGFKNNMHEAAKQVSEGNFEIAIEYILTAKEELKYFKTPGQISYENTGEKLKYSGYAVQGEKSVPVSKGQIHRRPQNTLQRLDDAIHVLQKHMDKSSIKENYSVKSIYSYLYS